MASDKSIHSVLHSSFPVLLPKDEALFMSNADFEAMIKQTVTVASHLRATDSAAVEDASDTTDSRTASSSATVSLNKLKRPASDEADNDRVQKAPFITGLEQHAAHLRTQDDLAADNKTLTANLDVTNISSKNALVDLFYDLSEKTRGKDLKALLDTSWNTDPTLTLKIIFNARSIHLGKSNRVASYKAFGWLAETHPLTLLANLKWLVRPVITKKALKPENEERKVKDADEDFDMIGEEEADPAKAHDVRYGVSHGYWKDLLNLVVFAANDQLKVDGDPASLLNQHPDNSDGGKRSRNWDPIEAKAARSQQKMEQNKRVQDKLANDPLYRALHLTVARLFAEQLKQDKDLLHSDKKSDLEKLSLAAKWAPTFGEFHDKHTFILSSIAEFLFPEPASSCPDATNRELYLRHIREHYRKQYASPLRKALNIVERDIAGNTFSNIHYERVPSLAMDRYTPLFLKKDTERFTSYIHDVTKGTANISGATLLPANLVAKARRLAIKEGNPKSVKAAKAAALGQVEGDVLNGQWNTLVARVQAAGTLPSSIAICDVSGSMTLTKFRDGSTPMDSAIGLSLLLSSVTAPPFGGGFITFSELPAYISINSTKGLVDMVKDMMRAPWGMSTDFVAVFEDVILPMAVANNLTQEQMVQKVFVFSDMQFNQANLADQRWTSSFERIKERFKERGYEMPTLVFWNLAATSRGDKPATEEDGNVALVSGYSQGMMRAMIESGALEETEEVEVEVEGEDGMTEIKTVTKKVNPESVVRAAVSSKAYDMLEVVD
ncbi:hypothetical protein DE146DRAFT_609767 [Phaeosphaeria sp. MPI-PUGE-AT-0046c]|nr:hypothetical protein DE146DRAFT_609767 [Phaeosphaeria sp. MPI-PUGE-AT-0046c]